MIHAERPLAHLVALDLAGRRCVVLGGGAMAATRVPALLDAGAQVTVVAERLEDTTLQALAGRGDIAWVARRWQPGDCRGAAVVYNTTDDLTIEAAVREEARAERALLNTHDRPAACDFASPAIVRRGRLQLAVSTSGDSPHVAAAVRERLEHLFGEEWGAQLALIARVRRRLRHAGVPMPQQLATYRRLMRSYVRDLLRRDASPATLDELVARATAPATATGPSPAKSPVVEAPAQVASTGSPPGTVHLVGAGPGDPGLLSVRARELLLDADVVFHDALVPPSILALCGAHARVVDVGKRGGSRRTDQDHITAQLIEAARAGLEVVRLKGGDPFVFGRGGEELAALHAAGVTTTLVPGITSAFAAPATAGIPLTLRGVAGSVAVVTGQDAGGRVPENLEHLAATVDTLVVLMPLHTLDAISAALVRARGPDWPAALIAGATTDAQVVVRATVGTIVSAALEAGISAPATLVTGLVVDQPAVSGVASPLAVSSPGESSGW